MTTSNSRCIEAQLGVLYINPLCKGLWALLTLPQQQGGGDAVMLGKSRPSGDSNDSSYSDCTATRTGDCCPVPNPAVVSFGLRP